MECPLLFFVGVCAVSDRIYHFTDSARLPWIWAVGELRPGRNQIGGMPFDFLWATTNRQGEARQF